MNVAKKEELLKLIETEISKTTLLAQKTDSAANVLGAVGLSKTPGNATEIVKDYLERLKKLKKEIENCSEDAKDSAKPVCLASIRYEDGSNLEFYLVENAVSLPGVLFIASSSPLGQALLGKKQGESFSYKLKKEDDERQFSAVVVRID